jgi:hypothetical protein
VNRFHRRIRSRGDAREAKTHFGVLIPVIVTEGGPDYLAALSRLWAFGHADDHEVVCMLGASQRLNEHAGRLRGRMVTIYCHHDENGQGLNAARRWQQEAIEAGAESVDIIEPAQPGDLNDLAT